MLGVWERGAHYTQKALEAFCPHRTILNTFPLQSGRPLLYQEKFRPPKPTSFVTLTHLRPIYLKPIKRHLNQEIRNSGSPITLTRLTRVSFRPNPVTLCPKSFEIE